jgi:hypothetical protein
MARIGLRMMPTFPSSSLKLRTAGFPRYGFKAGFSGSAFPGRRPRAIARRFLRCLRRQPFGFPARIVQAHGGTLSLDTDRACKQATITIAPAA